jgi:hypothetical protein
MPIVDGHIQCSACRELKPSAEYQPSVVKAGCGACRACKYKQKREYETRNAAKVARARSDHRQRNLDHHQETRRAHYRNNPTAYRGYNLARYGITIADYDVMLAAQGGGCACCGAKANRTGKRLFVDHDHDTGAVRGILCHKCNAGIGALGDSVDGVRRALQYLERVPSSAPPAASPSMRINLLNGAN